MTLSGMVTVKAEALKRHKPRLARPIRQIIRILLFSRVTGQIADEAYMPSAIA
jgi:hypothetical protein